MKKKFRFLFITSHAFYLAALAFGDAQGQNKMIDRVVAVVGKNIILQSDVETQYLQFLSQGNPPDANIKCAMLDQMLLHKLMVNQADIDSVTVSESQVDGELDRRIRYFVTQIGSEQKLEEYYKKSIAEIKADFREIIEDQLLAQTVQSKITKDITASPSDVKAYFESIHPDSVPYISSEIEVAQIVKFPTVDEEQKKAVREQLEDLKRKIETGKDFAVMAGLYSKDPSTAKKGGELGFINRGDLVPEFSAVAFSLKGKEISKVFETQYGFHIVQLIERRGSQINVRHILLKPEVSNASILAANNFLDSVHTLIKTGKISFADAAQKYSDDTETRNNGGLMMNPNSGTTHFEPDQLDPSVFFVIDKIQQGEMSGPVLFQTPDDKKAYRLLMLKTRTLPHRANLKDDYQRIQTAALNEKQNAALSEWVDKKRKTTYVRLDDDFKSCEILSDWVTKN